MVFQARNGGLAEERLHRALKNHAQERAQVSLSSGNQMEVHMRNGLIGDGAIVEHEIDVATAELTAPDSGGDSRAGFEESASRVCGQVADELVMALRNDQRMARTEGVDVEKGQEVFILVDLVTRRTARDDFAEDASGHGRCFDRVCWARDWRRGGGIECTGRKVQQWNEPLPVPALFRHTPEMSFDGAELLALLVYDAEDPDAMNELVSAALDDDGDHRDIAFRTSRTFGFGVTHPFNLELFDSLVELPWDLEVADEQDWEITETDDARLISAHDVSAALSKIAEIWDTAADEIRTMTEEEPEDLEEVLDGDADADELDSHRLAELLAQLRAALQSAEERELGVLLILSQQEG